MTLMLLLMETVLLKMRSFIYNPMQKGYFPTQYFCYDL